MIALWILGILAALILLLCLLRVGVEMRYQAKVLTLDVRIGLLRLHILPHKESKEEEPKREKKPKQAKKQAQKSGEKKKPTLGDIRDLAHTLWPPLKQALRKTRRGIRIHPLTVSATVGGREDPASAAQLYGELQAVVWGGMPVLEQLLVIPDPHIHIGIDFDTEEWDISANAGLSARVGTLMGIGWTLAVPAVKWYLRYRKKTTAPPQKAAAKQNAA